MSARRLIEQPRAGAVPVLRASVERCRREHKHLEWVDVDDLATVLDALEAAKAQRDTLAAALREIAAYEDNCIHQSQARAALAGVAPPGISFDKYEGDWIEVDTVAPPEEQP